MALHLADGWPIAPAGEGFRSSSSVSSLGSSAIVQPVHRPIGIPDPQLLRELAFEQNRARRAVEDDAVRWQNAAQMMEARLVSHDEKWQAALAQSQKEIRLAKAERDEAEERARKSEARLSKLAADSSKTALHASSVSGSLELQIELNSALQKELRQSKSQVEDLRVQLRESKYDFAGANSRAGDTEALLRSATEEAAEQAEALARCRLELNEAQTALNRDNMSVEAVMKRESLEKMSLGRKCQESYVAQRQHEEAASFWQQRTEAGEQEIVRLRNENQKAWQTVHHQYGELEQQRRLVENLEALRERDIAERESAQEASRNLQRWIRRSIAEVNKSAHGPVDRHAPGVVPFTHDRDNQAWIQMLENFRWSEQTRAGFGNRTNMHATRLTASGPRDIGSFPEPLRARSQVTLM
eukprot:gnl/TRDRNA2_/TRDRNA2_198097_c0_seq1.p1 gnl/TRDRNA2_/TRDRNA2_198097_c0~~gnl/TRDRNA2_/TRDRNA2_198097_c0_seq1.p1  ORF type:complete len:413 (+),score=84.33 gnl/TRDRNA2_/TRDRNA2_198097_c0_seq1:54-1292(+)